MHRDFTRGSIIIPLSDFPVKLFTSKFSAKLRWLASKQKLKVGYEPTFLYSVRSTSCRFVSVSWPETEGDDWVEVEMETRKPVYLESVHDCHPLSTFIIKDNSRTLGYGYVVKRLSE